MALSVWVIPIHKPVFFYESLSLGNCICLCVINICVCTCLCFLCVWIWVCNLRASDCLAICVFNLPDSFLFKKNHKASPPKSQAMWAVWMAFFLAHSNLSGFLPLFPLSILPSFPSLHTPRFRLAYGDVWHSQTVNNLPERHWLNPFLSHCNKTRSWKFTELTASWLSFQLIYYHS